MYSAAFCVLFLATLCLMFNNRVKIANKLLVSTLALMWVLSVAHWAIDITRAIQAFVYSPNGALAYYDNLANPLEPAKDALYVLLTMAGDLFMIYRCYMVWNRSWTIIVLPMLFWCGLAVGGLGSLRFIILAGHSGIFSKGPVPWITSFFAASLALNIFCTAAIAYRILRTRTMRSFTSSRVQTALIIFVESAAIYSASVLALVVVYLLGSSVHFILLDLTTSIIGVTFTLVTLRLALAYPPSDGSSQISASGRGTRNHGDSARVPHQNNSNSFPLTVVSVSRFVTVNADRSRADVNDDQESSFGKDDASSVLSASKEV
ncbi:hypothetical protein MKEN_01161200 [Mycena kentingensis (nom. inval.)]|nr:hypothetical protein MKEN_01161200 [Mycena kentingensis (nom. inval.)]